MSGPNRLTVAALRAQLADFADDAEVWVLDVHAPAGFSPATGIVVAGSDPDPAPGDPTDFVVIDTAQ